MRPLRNFKSDCCYHLINWIAAGSTIGVLPSVELIADYQAKHTALNAKLDGLLARIEEKLK